MDVVEPRTPGEFLERAGALLEMSEARHNLVYGVAGTLQTNPEVYEEFSLWVVERNGSPLAAAICTPPHPLAIADADDRGAIKRLVEAVARRYPELPAANGNVPTIERFVSNWTSLTGAIVASTMRMGVFQLDGVAPVDAVAGSPRPIDRSDVDMVVDWLEEFEREAAPDGPTARDRLTEVVERRLADGQSMGLWLWETHGVPVSLSGFWGPTPNGIRIGPVYTPPDNRRRGYASALVAAQSAWLLSLGRRFCFLFTDLSNPTSNRVYQRIGYRQIAEAARIGFEYPLPAG